MPSKPSQPLWVPSRIAGLISAGPIYQSMSESGRREMDEITDIEAKTATALTDPKPLGVVMPVLNAVLAAQYYEVFEALELPREMRVYEPCVGASIPVILATEAYCNGRGSYVAVNLNRKLREQLREKVAHVKTPVQVIEDNAQKVLELLPRQKFDVACFHHAVNDILQTAVSEPRGMDTTAIDWFPTERQMIEWLAEDANAHRLEERGKPELMQIVSDAIRLVGKNGVLIFDHFNWCKYIGVEWFPWELFYNLIPTTRRWIAESGLPVSEVVLKGVDQQWWLMLKATGAVEY